MLYLYNILISIHPTPPLTYIYYYIVIFKYVIYIYILYIFNSDTGNRTLACSVKANNPNH